MREIEKAAENFAQNDNNLAHWSDSWEEFHDYDQVKNAFIAGAEWMQKKMIDKACEWLNNNWREYVYQDGDGIVHFGHWKSDFRKAMED